jgi:tetratricopeptide (TPR) repeat protein
MAVTPDHERVLAAAAPRQGVMAAVLTAARRWLGPGRSGARRADASPSRIAVEAFNRAVALTAVGASVAAIEAYEQAIATGDGELRARAAFNIAALQLDDPRAAGGAYLQAIDTGHPDVAPKAAFNLGSLLAAGGDLAGARMMLELALDFGHQDVSARAALKLQLLAAEHPLDDGVPGTSRQPAARRTAEPPRSAQRCRSLPHRDAAGARRLRGSH